MEEFIKPCEDCLGEGKCDITRQNLAGFDSQFCESCFHIVSYLKKLKDSRIKAKRPKKEEPKIRNVREDIAPRIEIKKNGVYCGDSLDLISNIKDSSIDLVVTDPPYGMNWQSNNRKEKWDLIENDNDLSFLSEMVEQLHRVTKEDSHI